MSWLRRTVGASYEDFQERLSHLKSQCQPHITEAAKSSVEGICRKMYNLSVDYASKAAEKNAEILKEANIDENCEPVVVAHQRKVRGPHWLTLTSRDLKLSSYWSDYNDDILGLVLPSPVRHGLPKTSRGGDLPRQGDDRAPVQGGRRQDQQLLLP